MLGSFNIYGEKIGAGLIAGLVSYFVHNLVPLIVCALIFEVIDFGTGLWKSAVVASQGRELRLRVGQGMAYHIQSSVYPARHCSDGDA